MRFNPLVLGAAALCGAVLALAVVLLVDLGGRRRQPGGLRAPAAAETSEDSAPEAPRATAGASALPATVTVVPAGPASGAPAAETEVAPVPGEDRYLGQPTMAPAVRPGGLPTSPVSPRVEPEAVERDNPEDFVVPRAAGAASPPTPPGLTGRGVPAGRVP